MSFLEPWLLAALPLVALPIIIHLINQRRFQTIRWGAMMFLLAANRLSRGYARLRQWLIMAFRMLAIAALVFSISRPLASGWLGLAAGGRPDTTIILLDRSPSMQATQSGGGDSKLLTGRRQLAQTLKALGSAHWVLIENTTNKPRELDSPDALLTSPATESTSAASDLPAMLQAACDYIRANKAGRTDVWICSDIRENDWDPESGRWQSLRESVVALGQGIRFNLLAYPETAPGNVSIRVTDVRRTQFGEARSQDLDGDLRSQTEEGDLRSQGVERSGDRSTTASGDRSTTASGDRSTTGSGDRTTTGKNGDAADLVVSLRLAREGADSSRVSIPIHFEIDGARSELTVEMDRNQYELKEYHIPLESRHERGWGKVTIPADVNLADNDYYFVFEKPAPRHAVVVADDNQVARPLQLAAAIAPDPAVQCSAEIVTLDRLPAVEWEKVSLLLWQGPLPEGQAGRRVQDFVERGGYAVFFPPGVPGGRELFGARWKAWVDSDGKEVAVDNWRTDQDLLANTQSGAMLPLGQLQIRRYCDLAGDFTTLASVRGGAPLVVRSPTNRGGAYFLATTPAPGDSSLATNGVVLYVLVQRALAGGAAALGSIGQLTAGEKTPAGDPGTWQRVTGTEETVSTEYAFHRGVYAAGERLLAVNRPIAEDQAAVLDDSRVAGLFRGLDFIRVDHQAGQFGMLIQEIWRPFLASMLVALIVEAALCLPRLAGRSVKTREGRAA